MTIDEKIAEVVADLEHEIGSQTYNPNSYNGWTGEEGCSFTYPVQYCKNKEDLEAHRLSKSRKIDYLDPECIKTMRYAFGSNHLYIGKGIVDVLTYLEKRYRLDFNKLEEQRLTKIKKEYQKRVAKLEEGKEIIIESGRHRVGEDLPTGDYLLLREREVSYSYIMVDIYDLDGNISNHIFTADNEVSVLFEDGCMVVSHGYFKLRKDE